MYVWYHRGLSNRLDLVTKFFSLKNDYQVKGKSRNRMKLKKVVYNRYLFDYNLLREKTSFFSPPSISLKERERESS